MANTYSPIAVIISLKLHNPRRIPSAGVTHYFVLLELLELGLISLEKSTDAFLDLLLFFGPRPGLVSPILFTSLLVVVYLPLVYPPVYTLYTNFPVKIPAAAGL